MGAQVSVKAPGVCEKPFRSNMAPLYWVTFSWPCLSLGLFICLHRNNQDLSVGFEAEGL